MTFKEKVAFLVEKQAWRGAGEQTLILRTADAYAKNPEFVPAYNTKTLIDGCMATYERKVARQAKAAQEGAL